jgi:hypothetical protein
VGCGTFGAVLPGADPFPRDLRSRLRDPGDSDDEEGAARPSAKPVGISAALAGLLSARLLHTAWRGWPSRNTLPGATKASGCLTHTQRPASPWPFLTRAPTGRVTAPARTTEATRSAGGLIGLYRNHVAMRAGCPSRPPSRSVAMAAWSGLAAYEATARLPGHQSLQPGRPAGQRRNGRHQSGLSSARPARLGLRRICWGPTDAPRHRRGPSPSPASNWPQYPTP